MSHHTKLNFPFFSFSFCSSGENQNQGQHRFHGTKHTNLRCGWHQQVSVGRAQGQRHPSGSLSGLCWPCPYAPSSAALTAQASGHLFSELVKGRASGNQLSLSTGLLTSSLLLAHLPCSLVSVFFSLQMKLLNLYIKRAQTTNSNSSSSSDVSTHS